MKKRSQQDPPVARHEVHINSGASFGVLGKVLVDSETSGYCYEYEIHEILRVDVLSDGITLFFEGVRKWDLVKKPVIFICENIGR